MGRGRRLHTDLILTGVAAACPWERPRVVAAPQCVRPMCREHDVSVARGASLGHDSCIGAHTVIDEDAQVLQGDVPTPSCWLCRMPPATPALELMPTVHG